MPRRPSSLRSLLCLAAALTLTSSLAVAQTAPAPAESSEFAHGAFAAVGAPAGERATLAATSPGTAAAIGLFSTAAPIALGMLPRDEYSRKQPNLATTTIGVLVGVTLGPAIGLASGGRGDLAFRGALLRAAAFGLSTGAVLSVGASGEAGAVSLLVAGLSVAGLSALHDLAITPSAVAEGPPRPRAALAVRPDGALAVQVKF